jgi:flagellin-like hook-associated protein FlgL
LENLTKTELFIRDTDMAAEITEYASSQILFQTTASLLAQKKLDRQWILRLLE